MTSRNWINYWEKCIRDSNRMNNAIRDKLTVPIQQVSQGKLSSKAHQKLYQIAQQQQFENTHQRDNELQPLSVSICPLYAVKTSKKHKKSKMVALLWIPAIIESDGTLSINEDRLPWIPRDLLEPAGNADFTIGMLDDVETFLTTQPYTGDDWSSLWHYAVSLIRYVTETNQPSTELDVEGHVLPSSNNREAYVILSDDSSAFSYHLMRIYDYLDEQDTLPPLLQKYATSSSPELLDELSSAQEHAMSLQHTGQPHGKFPLAPSQRRALHHFLSMNEDGILAVNGPPGTGKTTLLQSVITTMWVSAALNQDDAPVIFATSSNNQAVTNVISSFDDIGVYQTADDNRWLPGIADDASSYIRSYGLYCCSSRQKKGLPAGWQIIDNKSSDFFLPIEKASYIERAVPHFLYECEKYFGRNFADLQDARQIIHQQLQKTANDLRRFLQSDYDVSIIELEYADQGGIEKYYSKIRRAFKMYQKTAQLINRTEIAWTEHVAQRSFAQKTMAIMPQIKAEIEKANADFCERHGLSDIDAYDDSTIIYFIQKKKRDITKKITRAKMSGAKVKQQRERHQTAHKTIEAIERQYNLPENDDRVTQADTILRVQCFVLATHYWEASWLIEMYEQLNELYDDEKWRLQDSLDLRNRWKRYAKLTPCFVSTLYMMPAFLYPRSGVPLTDFVDLLIIDEAGQVTPDTAVPAFSLAKQALVVGDRKQIEPISTLNKAVDFANVGQEGLARTRTIDEFFASDDRHRSVSKGSVMGIAQLASPYKAGTSQRGVFLREHRRCLPQIIGYCNELAYEGRLLALTDTLKKQADKGILELDTFPLPPMGYAHVPGHYKKLNGSKPHNPIEAHVIAQWLIENQNSLQERYRGSTLEDIVGVVTPFAHQAYLIEKELSRHELGTITVGTIHRLQGAERPVVIFSPAYSEFGRYWFDDSVNMLNVAVSRAKHSFLVFGNMRIFEHRPYNQERLTSPSTILAKYLFRKASNELTDIPIPKRDLGQAKDIGHITTLEGHRTALRESFQVAQNHLRIVSPYLTSAAVKADNIPGQVASAKNAGINITVYTDSQLNKDARNNFKPTMLQAKTALETAGAVVKVVRRVHSKIICVDQRILIEGSFNWLSAVRYRTSDYQRRESSFRYEGKDAGKFIKNTIDDLEQLVISKSSE